MISSPADTLFSVVSAPVFLFVGHGVGQNAILAGKTSWSLMEKFNSDNDKINVGSKERNC